MRRGIVALAFLATLAGCGDEHDAAEVEATTAEATAADVSPYEELCVAACAKLGKNMESMTPVRQDGDEHQWACACEEES